MGSPLSVLFVMPRAYPESIGGRTVYVHGLTRVLSARGLAVTVLSGSAAPELSPVEGEGVNYAWYQVRPDNLLKEQYSHFCGLARQLRALEARGAVFDVIFYTDPVCIPPLVSGRYFPKAKRIYLLPSPVSREAEIGLSSLARAPVWRLRDQARSLLYRGYKVWAHQAEERGLQQSELIICLSTHMRRELLAAHPWVRTPIAVIPGGVDLDRFQPLENRAYERAERGLDADQKLIVTARRLEPHMGLDNLIRAMSQVLQAQRAQLWIAGEGPERTRLERMIVALGLSDSVRFLGPVSTEELPRLYALADLFALPTRLLEGFGLATLEVLACGTPVAATPVGATAEWLAPFDPRMLSHDTTSRGLAEAFKRMLAVCEAEGEQLRRGCRNYAEKYHWEGVARQVEEQVCDLLGGDRSKRTVGVI